MIFIWWCFLPVFKRKGIKSSKLWHTQLFLLFKWAFFNSKYIINFNYLCISNNVIKISDFLKAEEKQSKLSKYSLSKPTMAKKEKVKSFAASVSKSNSHFFLFFLSILWLIFMVDAKYENRIGTTFPSAFTNICSVLHH